MNYGTFRKEDVEELFPNIADALQFQDIEQCTEYYHELRAKYDKVLQSSYRKVIQMFLLKQERVSEVVLVKQTYGVFFQFLQFN